MTKLAWKKPISYGEKGRAQHGRNLSIDQSGNLCGGYWSGGENLVPLSGMLNSRNHSGGAELAQLWVRKT